MVTHLGTFLGTELGTDLGEFQDGTPRFDPTKLYALTGMSNLHVYKTALDGGEAGIASGFGVVDLVVVEKISGAVQAIASRMTTGVGWQQSFDTSTLYTAMRDGVGTSIGTRLTNGHVLTASDAGKVFALVSQHTGSAVQTLAYDGSLKRSVAITGYTPASAGTQHVLGPGSADTSVTPFASFTYRGTPTDAHLQAALLAIRALGRLPTKAALEAVMPGTTVTHRWSLYDVLLAANVPVTTGTVGPLTIPDSVTAATIDEMARTGSPTVRVIDPSIDGITTYGALGFTASNCLQSALGASFRGSAAGFTVRIVVTFQSITGGPFYFASCSNGSASSGWSFLRNVAALTYYVGNGSAARGAGKTLTAADVGTPHLLHLVYNGSVVEAFYDGVSLGVSTSGSYSPAAGTNPLTIGGLGPTPTYPATNENVFSLSGANHVATAGEVAADYAAWARTRRLADITASKPDANRYEITHDVIANGTGNGIPATVQDRVGTDHLTRVGTGLQVAQRVERTWSYESTPILRGVTGYDPTTYLESATTGHDGGASGKSIAVLFRVDGQTVSKTRDLVSFGGIGATSGRIEMRFTGLNTATNFVWWTGAAFVITPSAVLTAADVGKLILIVSTWDAPATKVRLYHKRAEVSTGTTAASYAPDASTKMRVGTVTREDIYPAYFASELSWFGTATYDGIWTLAEIQALYDSAMANERIEGVPGKTDHLYRVPVGGGVTTVSDLVGTSHLTAVGTLTATDQYARAWNW